MMYYQSMKEMVLDAGRAGRPPFLQQQSQSFFLSSSFGEMDGGEAIHCSSPLCLMRHGSRKKQGEEMSSSSSGLPQVDDGGLLDHPSFYDYQIGEKKAHKDGLDRRSRLRGSVGSFLRWLTLCASGNAIGFFRSCLLPGDCHSLGSKIVLQFMLCCRLVGIT